MSKTKIAPALAKAVSGSIHAEDWPAMRRELRAFVSAIRAAERVVPWAIGMDVGVWLFVGPPKPKDAQYPGPPEVVKKLDRALSRLKRGAARKP